MKKFFFAVAVCLALMFSCSKQNNDPISNPMQKLGANDSTTVVCDSCCCGNHNGQCTNDSCCGGKHQGGCTNDTCCGGKHQGGGNHNGHGHHGK